MGLCRLAQLAKVRSFVRGASALLVIFSMSTSCDSDVLGGNKKRVAGDYFLSRFSEGGELFYLDRKGADTQGGVFQAVIEEIGWSKDFIVCKVKKQFSNDVSGIYSLEVSTGRIEGPLTESGLTSEARFREIKLENVKKAYDRL